MPAGADSLEPIAGPSNAPSSAQASTPKSLVKLTLSQWETLAFKGYSSILPRVEELWWVPVLYDDACRDKATFWNYAKDTLRKAIQEQRKRTHNLTAAQQRKLELEFLNNAHKRILRDLQAQQKLYYASQPHQQLRAGLQTARRLRTLVIRPTRLGVRDPKPESLNVYALTSIIAALTPQDDHPPRGISTLRIFDVDLCALLACAPCSRYAPPLAVDVDGYSLFLPPTLRSWHDMHVAWCDLVRDLESLHCAFLRPEALEPRLQQLRRGSGESVESQMERISSVLAVCSYLKELKLAFHKPLPQSTSSGTVHPSSSAADDSSMADAALQAQSLTPSPSPPPTPAHHNINPVELDIRWILPFCDAFQSPRFPFLRDFVLSTVLLQNSEPLLQFIRNHTTLESLTLLEIGFREGPNWTDPEFIQCLNSSHLYKLTINRLLFIDSTGAVEHEGGNTYDFLKDHTDPRIQVIHLDHLA
ncbi:hypothetical protein EXIGLDRAFT_750369 [Exidia glandulosa HHB12029]|uniref:F-box domain-containing protein n=1 Tax=Exidia glandulosa HHB12029 TaxID=1314781 RepID=A0A165GSY7_EXIGL|nr:hypothetical protein EXIGLDRAFT_750369 [Exidia glandulosa HHB12029]